MRLTGGHDERGSVLILVPVGLLVLVILGSLAVDSAVQYLGQEQLHDALSAAANDAVTAGIDSGSFYRGGRVTLDPAEVAKVVCLDLLAQGDSQLHDVTVSAAISGDSVRLEGAAVVESVFGRALPGFASHTVHSSSSAVGAQGPLGPNAPDPAGPMVPLDCTS